MLIYRWIAFIIAFMSVYILTRPNVDWQWFGWVLSAVSCIVWIIVALKQEDTPRCLMEVMYFVMAVWGVVNWYGY